MTSHRLPRKNMFMVTALLASLGTVGSLGLASIARAADTDSPAVPVTSAPASNIAPPTTAKPAAAVTTNKPAAIMAVDHMAQGRAAVAKSEWKTAITEFTMAVDENPQNADANNMLAYSYRKSGDLKSAFTYYAIALKIDPKHKGALEYQGEAFVQNGELTKAKANLAKLKTICGTTCEEYKDLAAFIAKAPKAKTTKKK